VSLKTPIKIREFQRKLYTKAKQEPAYRFYLLYDKICREDILTLAYRLGKANAGAPGVDGQSFLEIETEGQQGLDHSSLSASIHANVWRASSLSISSSGSRLSVVWVCPNWAPRSKRASSEAAS